MQTAVWEDGRGVTSRVPGGHRRIRQHRGGRPSPHSPPLPQNPRSAGWGCLHGGQQAGPSPASTQGPRDPVRGNLSYRRKEESQPAAVGGERAVLSQERPACQALASLG